MAENRSPTSTTGVFANKSLLVLEDEPDLADTLVSWLAALGAQVHYAEDGHQAVKLLTEQAALDLALLDIMTPGIDGLGVLEEIRASETYSHLPVLMLTAKTQESDEIRGLHGGADAYLKKPVRLPLLQAHLERLLQRGPAPAAPAVQSEADTLRQVLPGLQLDASQHLALWQGRELNLTPSEWTVLDLLAQHPGRRYSREDILYALEDNTRQHFVRTVDAHIKNLRHKLEPDSGLIRTYRGLGYGLDPDYQPHSPTS